MGEGKQDQKGLEVRMAASPGKDQVRSQAQHNFSASHSAAKEQQPLYGKWKQIRQPNIGVKACSSMQKDVVEDQCLLDKVSDVPPNPFYPTIPLAAAASKTRRTFACHSVCNAMPLLIMIKQSARLVLTFGVS